MTTPVTIDPNQPPWLSLSLASPVDIYSWSYGAIETDKLFDFERRRFHDAGLFSERIFGPIRDHQCACRKFCGADHLGAVCDECGVSIRPRSVRRERMGHINLPAPVVHPWFWGHDRAPIELLLGLTHQQLQRLVARRRFIPLGSPTPHLRSKLCAAAVAQAEGDRTVDGFLARSGGDAVRRLLHRIDFDSLLRLLEARLEGKRSQALERELAELGFNPLDVKGVLRQCKQLKARIELVRQVVRSGAKPHDMVIEVLPVIPAGLRRGEVAGDGRIAVDGVTARYRRILRLCRVIREGLELVPVAQGAWLSGDGRRRLVKLERRLAAEIAGLFDELLQRGSLASRSGHIRDRRRRGPGKRVDYSARSVVVPDPSLRLFECRIPRKEVAEVLLRDFISPIGGPTPIDPRQLESEATRHPLVFNFAPAGDAPALASLHPRLTEDRATHVHPLAATALGCSPGELEATIHLPLSLGAEIDCDRLSFPRIALRDAVSGECKLNITADAAVGCYYACWLSDERRKERDKVIGNYSWLRTSVAAFASIDDVQTAWEERRVRFHDLIQLRLAAGQPLFHSATTPVDEAQGMRRAWTTVGRALMNLQLPPGSQYYDVPFNELDLSSLTQRVLTIHGELTAERFVERATAFGLHALTRAGLSLSQSELRPPAVFPKRMERLTQDVAKLNRLYDRGVICDAERRGQIEDASRAVQEELAAANVDAWESASGPMPLMLAVFKSRGGYSRPTLNQLVGIVGSVWSPWTIQLPAPVLKSLSQGLDPQGYFRLAAANRRAAMYERSRSEAPKRLQRHVATALAEVVVAQEDCGARTGIAIDRGRDEPTAAAFERLIEGRVILHALHDANRQGIIVEANELISRQAAQAIAAHGISSLRVRSPLTCRARHGICRKCYGADPATGRLVELGAAVGVKAALAIGGTLRAIINLRAPSLDRGSYATLDARESGVVSLWRLRTALDEQGRLIVASPGGIIEIHEDDGAVHKHRVPHGAFILAATGSQTAPGTTLAAWYRHRTALFASDAGTVHILQADTEKGPRLLTVVNSTGAVIDGCYLPADARVQVSEGAKVDAGTPLASYFRACDFGVAPTGDRFQRLAILLSGRQRRDRAALAPVDGRIELKADLLRRRCTILLHPLDGGLPRHYHVPWGADRFPVVRTGQMVQPGDPLTWGHIDLADLARTRGVEHVQSLLLTEVYARLADLKGDRPSDERPWELMIAQMLGWVYVEAGGDTAFQVGDVVRRNEALWTNRDLRKKLKFAIPGEEPLPIAVAVVSRKMHDLNERQRREANPNAPEAVVSIPWPVGWSSLFLGMDAISRRESFLTAGGFLPTRAALVDAALACRRDPLDRVQESLLAGRLMPAGSGWGVRDD